MARTTIDEPRSCKVWTYLTPTEQESLQAFAAALDVTVSTVVRAFVQQAIYNMSEGLGSAAGVRARESLSVPREPEPAGDWAVRHPGVGEPITDPLPPGSQWAGSGYQGVPMPPWAVRRNDPLDD